MRIANRLGALALVSVIVSAFLVSPANAQTDRPERFVAAASARAVDLNVLGIHLTLGSSGALITSEPVAKADGAGALLVAGTVSHAEVNAPNQSQEPPKACVLNLPVAGLLAVSAACGEAKANTNGGVPNARGAGNVATIELQGQQLLNTLLDLLTPLLNSVISTVDTTLNGLLGGLLDPLVATLGLNPETGLVADLVAGLKKATGLLTVSVGESISDANTYTDKVAGNAVANGVRVDVLPGLALGGAPLLSIIVGKAGARAEYNRTSGVAVPTFDPAIATVRLGLPILGGVTEVPIKLGAPLTLLQGTPLESTISLGAGQTSKDADGTVHAIADGVSLQLLKGLSGGIGLELAHAEASAGGQTKIVTQQQVVTPVAPQPVLAKTGSDPWLPLAGAVLLFAAYGTRRLIARPAPIKQRVDQ